MINTAIFAVVIAVLNIASNHVVLTRAKSIKFCLTLFVLNTMFYVIAGLFLINYIHNSNILKYLLFVLAFLYIVYIQLVFKESMSKKIFVMFSTWMFAEIALYIATISAQLLAGIFDEKNSQRIIYFIRFAVQIMLLIATYLWISKPYKKVLKLVSDKIIKFMSLYPLIGLLLLFNINSYPSFEHFNGIDSVCNLILLLVFIILGYVLVFAGISSASQVISLQHNMEELEWTSKTDSLTGLYNRRYIMEKLENECKRKKKRFSLIMADIDFFKNINDTFGHDCGDHVLKVISQTLKGTVREQDFVSRWGGEEFLLLLPETEIEGACLLVDRIKKITEEQIIEYDKVKVSITMTFGVTESQDYETIEDIIKKADNALYEGKSRGRNCVILAQ